MRQKYLLNCYICEYSKKGGIGLNITQIYNDHKNSVYRLALTYLHSRTEAEDVCHDVFVKMMEHKSSIFQGKERAWLLTVTANECKNRLKFWKRHENEELSANIPMKDTQSLDVLEVVRSLSVKERTVIYLYYYEGYTTEEIAGILKITASAVRSRMERARKHLKIERVYQITTDSYTEYDMDEVYTCLGDRYGLFNVKYVNSHIIALTSPEQCVLYDIDTQKVVKSLPYDLTMTCLRTRDQFLIYGEKIYNCLNAETLEEQEPEEGLAEFVKMMYQKNGNDVMPPMDSWNDTIVCVTKRSIYEYKDGEIKQIREHSGAVNAGKAFNGLLPICKAGGGEYYVCTFSSMGMALWQIDGDKEEMK